jgi:hypothetical protein
LNFPKVLILRIKVLATCGIRKILDFIFTQEELYLLDDILPGANRHKKNIQNDDKICHNTMSNNQIYKRNLEASKSVRR